jgi:hypothetical protein
MVLLLEHLSGTASKQSKQTNKNIEPIPMPLFENAKADTELMWLITAIPEKDQPRREDVQKCKSFVLWTGISLHYIELYAPKISRHRIATRVTNCHANPCKNPKTWPHYLKRSQLFLPSFDESMLPLHVHS